MDRKSTDGDWPSSSTKPSASTMLDVFMNYTTVTFITHIHAIRAKATTKEDCMI